MCPCKVTVGHGWLGPRTCNTQNAYEYQRPHRHPYSSSPFVTVLFSVLVCFGAMGMTNFSSYAPVGGDDEEADQPRRPRDALPTRYYAMLGILVLPLLNLGLFFFRAIVRHSSALR